jgi:hypothetical protein
LYEYFNGKPDGNLQSDGQVYSAADMGNQHFTDIYTEDTVNAGHGGAFSKFSEAYSRGQRHPGPSEINDDVKRFIAEAPDITKTNEIDDATRRLMKLKMSEYQATDMRDELALPETGRNYLKREEILGPLTSKELDARLKNQIGNRDAAPTQHLIQPQLQSLQPMNTSNAFNRHTQNQQMQMQMPVYQQFQFPSQPQPQPQSQSQPQPQPQPQFQMPSQMPSQPQFQMPSPYPSQPQPQFQMPSPYPSQPQSQPQFQMQLPPSYQQLTQPQSNSQYMKQNAVPQQMPVYTQYQQPTYPIQSQQPQFQVPVYAQPQQQFQQQDFIKLQQDFARLQETIQRQQENINALTSSSIKHRK